MNPVDYYFLEVLFLFLNLVLSVQLKAVAKGGCESKKNPWTTTGPASGMLGEVFQKDAQRPTHDEA